MRDRPAARTRVGLELDELLEDAATGRVHAERPLASPGPLIGEVVDTHHPHRSGRILVRWDADADSRHEAWLRPTAHVRPRCGDRVVVERPRNYCEWIVTGVLLGEPEAPQPLPAEPAARVALEPGKALRIDGSDGTPMAEIQQSAHGPVLRLLSRDLEVAVDGRLRFSADRIECVSGQGGTDLRSDGEMVMRSPRIRLN